MNATASLSPTLHVRRGHIAGLALAVAAVTVVALATTWAVRANSDTPPHGFVSGVVSMAPAERAAAFGQTPVSAHQSLQQIVSTITPPQDFVTGVVSMAPAERAAAFGQTPVSAHQSLQQIVSTITPPQDFVTGVVAMAPAERAAAFGQTPVSAHQSLQQIVSTITPPAPLSHSHVGGQRAVESPQRPDAIFGPR